MKGGCGVGASSSDRGQLVLVAAAAIALALFPLVLAYLQLGYAGDVGSEPTGTDTATDLERATERVVHGGAATVDAGDYTDGDAAAAAFREATDDELRELEAAGVETGVAAEIHERESLANEWVASGAWTDDVAGTFAEPTVHGGIVVQERDGEYVVLAVALETTVTRSDGVVERELVIRVPG